MKKTKERPPRPQDLWVKPGKFAAHGHTGGNDDNLH